MCLWVFWFLGFFVVVGISGPDLFCFGLFISFV